MTDTFRTTYRPLTKDQSEAILNIKLAAESLQSALNAVYFIRSTDCRELAIARTKLEECVMWATKAIT